MLFICGSPSTLQNVNSLPIFYRDAIKGFAEGYTVSCNTAAEGMKAQNRVPCLLEDNVLYINWFFALLSEYITGIMPGHFIRMKQTKSGILQHFVIQLLNFFDLFIIVGSARTTETATTVHRAVLDEETWTKSVKKEREV